MTPTLRPGWNKLAFAVAVPLTLVLSGCTGSSEPEEGDEVVLPSSADDPVFDESTGAITGFIVTTDYSVIAGAQLLLVPGDVEATSAQDGGYTFSQLQPGRYTVHAVKLQYHNAKVDVDVRAGESTTQDIQMIEYPVAHPRKEVLHYDGFLECRWASFGSGLCGSTGVCTNGCITTQDVAKLLWTRDMNEFLFQMTGEDWQEIVIEVRWQASSVATNPEMVVLFSFKERPGNHEFGSSSPLSSPLWWNYTRGIPGQNARLPAGLPTEPNMNLTLRAWLAVAGDIFPNIGTDPYGDEPPIGVAYETRFEMYVTTFYSQKAPPDYTAFGDG